MNNQEIKDAVDNIVKAVTVMTAAEVSQSHIEKTEANKLMRESFETNGTAIFINVLCNLNDIAGSLVKLTETIIIQGEGNESNKSKETETPSTTGQYR